MMKENAIPNTYLFVWNPDKWPWPDIADDCTQLRTGSKVTSDWNCVSHKKVKRGDRAFFSRVGSEPRGIFASGYVVSEPFLSVSRKGKEIHNVVVEFDVLLDPDKEPILTLDVLAIGAFSAQTWTPQSSGISIKPEIVKELELLWDDFLKHHNNPHALPL